MPRFGFDLGLEHLYDALRPHLGANLLGAGGHHPVRLCLHPHPGLHHPQQTLVSWPHSGPALETVQHGRERAVHVGGGDLLQVMGLSVQNLLALITLSLFLCSDIS